MGGGRDVPRERRRERVVDSFMMKEETDRQHSVVWINSINSKKRDMFQI